MSWKDLIQKEAEHIVLPWTGFRSFQSSARTYHIERPFPREHGWYRFRLSSRLALCICEASPNPDGLGSLQNGYLAGNRFLPDSVSMTGDPMKTVQAAEEAFLIEEGIDRFSRVSAGRFWAEGPLVFHGQEMPLGPESDVLNAFLDKVPVLNVPNVAPALHAAFVLESLQRKHHEARLEELRRQREEEERKQREAELRENWLKSVGSSQGRRTLAAVDFGEAAKAALAMGGAEYLDHRAGRNGEMVVRFRLINRRFECTCDARTLQIIEAGVCLTDESTGEKYDQRFNLETLPSVIKQADREGVLVVFRHV